MRGCDNGHDPLATPRRSAPVSASRSADVSGPCRRLVGWLSAFLGGLSAACRQRIDLTPRAVPFRERVAPAWHCCGHHASTGELVRPASWYARRACALGSVGACRLCRSATRSEALSVNYRAIVGRFRGSRSNVHQGSVGRFAHVRQSYILAVRQARFMSTYRT